MRKSTIVLLVTALASLGYVNGIAWYYATIRSEGTLVYLELAPVDPLSLVQGQYMQLRFKLEQDGTELHEEDLEPFTLDPNADVLAVLELDNNRIGTVTRLIPSNLANTMTERFDNEFGSTGYALLSIEVNDEFRSLVARSRHQRPDHAPSVSIKLRQNSFLFEENTPDRYEQARYGILRVTAGGDYILVDLAGADLLPLTPTRNR